jgi:hypothetical protein
VQVLTVAQLEKAGVNCAEADAARPDVGKIISAHSFRETTAQDDGGSKKKGKWKREGRSKPKQHRARAKAKI